MNDSCIAHRIVSKESKRYLSALATMSMIIGLLVLSIWLSVIGMTILSWMATLGIVVIDIWLLRNAIRASPQYLKQAHKMFPQLRRDLRFWVENRMGALLWRLKDLLENRDFLIGIIIGSVSVWLVWLWLHYIAFWR